MGLSARAQKVQSCARLCGRDVHRNFFPIIPLIVEVLNSQGQGSQAVTLKDKIQIVTVNIEYLLSPTSKSVYIHVIISLIYVLLV